jgi:circadian clock protein KaiC
MADDRRLSSGVIGLDDVLHGGFPAGYMCLIEGTPGAGKTTLGLQFIVDGLRRNERTLYVLLTENVAELRHVAAKHGWSLEGVHLYAASHSDSKPEADRSYTIFHPAEAELDEVFAGLLMALEQSKAERVVFDSLSELRYLAQDTLRYRRLILTLKERLARCGATTLLLDYQESGNPDHQLETICHGVIALEQRAPEYGTERRRLLVRKMRGVEYRSGFHDFNIRRGGMEVYPRLSAIEHQSQYAPKRVTLGVPEMDTMLGGGLDRGTSTLIIGPAGVGKSSLAGHYAFSSAEAGDKVAMFLFEEVANTFLERTEGLNIGLRRHVTSGQVTVCQLNSAAVSPGEFASLVRDAVERKGVRTVVIDSINGYFSAMPQEHFLSVHLHELLTYLNQQGVMSLLIVSQHGVLGPTMIAPIDISYLADSVVLLRFFEAEGSVRQAISIVKKRSGPHERTIREFFLGPQGIRVGNALREFRGILTGNLLSTAAERGPHRSGGSDGAHEFS